MESRPPESCIEECVLWVKRARILEAKVEIRDEWDPGPRAESIDLMVKSLTLPSVDEIPILSAILRTLYDRKVGIYEYEALPLDEARVDRLTRLINHSFKTGRGIILVAPSLLPVSLISRLDQDKLEILESKLALEATIRYTNTLYLPDPNTAGVSSIEIVAKRNSEASYERAEWLKYMATRLGLRVERIRSLEDNTEILRYITMDGVNTLYTRIPVTKVASLVVALSRCLSLDGILPLEKRDTATHLIYALGITFDEARRIGERILGYTGMLVADMWMDIFEEHVNTGCSRGMASLYSRVLD
ncbi:MAG: hypothetical protein F7B18_06985 [Desulfurococcales archaeon]|nr:hypothetical protein [Desulfurococcales archaeon]